MGNRRLSIGMILAVAAGAFLLMNLGLPWFTALDSYMPGFSSAWLWLASLAGIFGAVLVILAARAEGELKLGKVSFKSLAPVGGVLLAGLGFLLILIKLFVGHYELGLGIGLFFGLLGCLGVILSAAVLFLESSGFKLPLQSRTPGTPPPPPPPV